MSKAGVILIFNQHLQKLFYRQWLYFKKCLFEFICKGCPCQPFKF